MWKRILKTCAILYFPLLVLTLIWASFQKREQLASISHVQKKNISNKNYHLVDLCQSLIHNTRFWSNIAYPITFGTDETEIAFIDPYLNTIEGLEDYDQLRFLDLHGDELLRYERNPEGEMVKGVPQSKTRRPYFQKGLSLKKGQIYLSPIELNQEHGKIEVPHKPVIRGVAPIFNVNDEEIGLVVINFKMGRIFERLKSSISEDHFYLVDDVFNIITSNTSANDLAFQSQMTQQDSLDKKRLELDGLLFKKDTVFVENGSLWVYENVHLGFERDTGMDRYSEPVDIVTENRWGVIQEIPPSYLDLRLKPIYRNLLVFNILTALLIGLIALGYARSQKEKNSFLERLKDKKEALVKSQKELERANLLFKRLNERLQIRNRQLEDFNYVVAHNLKAPVSSMAIIVDLLKNTEDQNTFKELFPKLESIATSISTLTEDVQTYVSILNKKEFKLENLNLLLMVKELENDFTETLLKNSDEGFEVIYKFDAWHTLKSSRFFMKSILQNFLSNAIKYKREDVASHVIFETAMEGNRKVLYIKDNGLGIDMEKHGKSLFKLYKRFHRNISGKGMGLFIVRSQLEALNATVQVESQEGVGTSFKIKFSNL
ncbi:sensor histidine kinase [Allomuricauda sp. M10]|uniref:sensor histidine kinase n=1 Tax=Allomuricauda sp. M10 TaxID=2683292 RepID=UPI001D194554|nr:sensor histidine kinase [Muricauda sp. M10]